MGVDFRTDVMVVLSEDDKVKIYARQPLRRRKAMVVNPQMETEYIMISTYRDTVCKHVRQRKENQAYERIKVCCSWGKER